MSGEILAKQRQTWSEKTILRAIYEDYYRRMVLHCEPGLTLEIGGGSGNLKSFLDQVVSTDIIPTPWLDAAADAQKLPFADGVFSNVLAIDVLHHIELPVRFFRESERVLRPGGRIVLLEPGISTLSRFFYRYLHPEPIDLNADPFKDGDFDPCRKPFDANQAIPTLFFIRMKDCFEAVFPELKIAHIEWLSLFAYPLSGGFRSWNVIPAALLPGILSFEDMIARRIGKYVGFRLMIVLIKKI
ncbi:MAG: class I SAM-dependent methyltransferase [Gammaproteobacteria bacterium]